jgi:hypothetical protein
VGRHRFYSSKSIHFFVVLLLLALQFLGTHGALLFFWCRGKVLKKKT